MTMIVDIDNAQDSIGLDLDELERLFRTALQSLGLAQADLSVRLVEEGEIARLNERFLGVSGPTDVLAFPQLELQPSDPAGVPFQEALASLPPNGVVALGDIAICPKLASRDLETGSKIQKESTAQGPEDERAMASALVGASPGPEGPESQLHLVSIHGLLHLLGHDHHDLASARLMAAAQTRLLRQVSDCRVLLAEGAKGSQAPRPAAPQEPTCGCVERSGFVALVGRPNVGKSTLMNRLIGSKVSIVSKKPQTTRNRLLGIVTQGNAQVVFIDTPGIHRSKDSFNRRLVDTALRSLREADLICVMLEPSEVVGPEERMVIQSVVAAGNPAMLLINKVDRVQKKNRLLPIIEALSALAHWEEVFPISALKGTNLQPLMRSIQKRLPKGPPLFPLDQLTDVSERFLVAERVREKIFQMTRQEIPYATAVEVTGWQEEKGLLRIAAKIFVERASQKGIVIGKGGAMLKKIGTAARKDLESFFACKVYLELHVAVSEGWRQSDTFLGRQRIV